MEDKLLSAHIVGFKNHLKILGYSGNAQQTIPVCIAEFLQNQNKPLQSLTAPDIASYYEYLSERPNKRRAGGLSSKMISSHLYAIRLFFNYHEQNGTITENPISGLSFPRAESEEREVLSIQEAKNLYDVADCYREKAIIGIFYGCGLRRSEGVALNVKDISFKSSVLYVREGKGKKRRAVPVNAKVLQDFKNYLYKERFAPNGELAFMTNMLGNRTSGNSYNKTVKQLVERAGIEKAMSLHGLRHSIATHLLGNGMGVEYVRDFLGHKHLDTTQIYTRVSKKQLRELWACKII